MNRTNRSLQNPSGPKQPQPKTENHQYLTAKWDTISVKDNQDPQEAYDDLEREDHWLDRHLRPYSVVLMGDFLMILADDDGDGEDDYKDSDEFDSDESDDYVNSDAGREKKKPDYYTHLIAVDLRDFSAQQIRGEAHERRKSYYDDFGYTLQKYSENQMIDFRNDPPEIITIESFEPLSAKWQAMSVKGGRSCRNVHVYKDCIYKFDFDDGEKHGDKKPNVLWCYDMSIDFSAILSHSFSTEDQTWRTCETIGEGPGSRINAKSLIFGGNLYVYGGYSSDGTGKYPDEKDILMLNLDTMKWTKFQQPESYFPRSIGLSGSLSGDIYKDHLMIFSPDKYYESNPQFRCWNTNTNSWRIFNIDRREFSDCLGRIVIHEDLLVIVEDTEEEISLATYDLKNLGLETQAFCQEEQQHLKSLFMNEEKSDFKFKVQDLIIPAHKEVLTSKFQSFRSLFKSGMADTKKGIVEIKDCDSVVFREFLRFVYCNKIEFEEKLLALKLLEFAEKHLQDDLKERCLYYLQASINSKTVFPIFEEAYAKNIQKLMVWCSNYLRINISLENISEIVQFLIPKQNRYPSELKEKVFDWIIENYFKIYQKQSQCLRLCEEFLVQNIEEETIMKISRFIAGEWTYPSEIVSFQRSYKHFTLGQKFLANNKEQYEKEIKREAEEVFEQETMKLRGAAYLYMQRNFELVRKEQDNPPRKFLMGTIGFIVPKLKKNKSQGDCEVEKGENRGTRGRKRMEPSQNEAGEKPELKKTKK